MNPDSIMLKYQPERDAILPQKMEWDTMLEFDESLARLIDERVQVDAQKYLTQLQTEDSGFWEYLMNEHFKDEISERNQMRIMRVRRMLQAMKGEYQNGRMIVGRHKAERYIHELQNYFHDRHGSERTMEQWSDMGLFTMEEPDNMAYATDALITMNRRELQEVINSLTLFKKNQIATGKDSRAQVSIETVLQDLRARADKSWQFHESLYRDGLSSAIANLSGTSGSLSRSSYPTEREVLDGVSDVPFFIELKEGEHAELVAALKEFGMEFVRVENDSFYRLLCDRPFPSELIPTMKETESDFSHLTNEGPQDDLGFDRRFALLNYLLSPKARARYGVTRGEWNAEETQLHLLEDSRYVLRGFPFQELFDAVKTEQDTVRLIEHMAFYDENVTSSFSYSNAVLSNLVRVAEVIPRSSVTEVLCKLVARYPQKFRTRHPYPNSALDYFSNSGKTDPEGVTQFMWALARADCEGQEQARPEQGALFMDFLGDTDYIGYKSSSEPGWLLQRCGLPTEEVKKLAYYSLDRITSLVVCRKAHCAIENLVRQNYLAQSDVVSVIERLSHKKPQDLEHMYDYAHRQLSTDYVSPAVWERMIPDVVQYFLLSSERVNTLEEKFGFIEKQLQFKDADKQVIRQHFDRLKKERVS